MYFLDDLDEEEYEIAIKVGFLTNFLPLTGKSLSEALILRSPNPQYDKRFFIDLPVQYMKTKSSVVYTNCFAFVFVLTFRIGLIQNNLCTKHVLSL